MLDWAVKWICMFGFLFTAGWLLLDSWECAATLCGAIVLTLLAVWGLGASIDAGIREYRRQTRHSPASAPPGLAWWYSAPPPGSMAPEPPHASRAGLCRS
jgi:hypothetical protein